MKRLIICCVSLLASCIIQAQNEKSVEETTINMTDIRKAMEQYDYEVVIDIVPPMAGDTLFTPLRAQALKSMGRLSETLAEWNSLLSADSANVKLIMELAECYRQLGNINKTMDCYRKAIELKPQNKFFRIQYIRTLLNARKYEKAKTACHEWLKIDTISAVGYKYLGQVYEGMTTEEINELLNAFLCYNMAYRRDSLDAQVVARIANLFNLNQQYQDAIDITETYRLTDTMNINVNRQNAKAYCLNKEYKKSIERHEALKQMGDNSFMTLYYLGMSYYNEEQIYEAYDILKEARHQNPQDINVLYYLAQTCVRTSYKEEGLTYMQKAIELTTPNDTLMARLYGCLAECYMCVNKPYDQIEALKEQYKRNKKRVIYYRIAQIYDDEKDYTKAIQYYEKYMAMVPEEERVRRDENGNPLNISRTYYQLAERRVRLLKEDDFFRNGVKKL